jgi:predicted DNA-binding WGR domain protein
VIRGRALQADLLADWSLVREWGRIGRPWRFAETAAQQLEVRKRRRGYG